MKMTFSHFQGYVYEFVIKCLTVETFLTITIVKMTELIARKKHEKRKALMDAAYSLFIHKGVARTSIAEICKEAGIAKGTFYLYFKDKDDILRALTKRISGTILKHAYDKVPEDSPSFVESAVIMADYLMDLFNEDSDLVHLMRKDFVFPITEDEFMHTDDPTMSTIRKDISTFSKQCGLTMHQIVIRLYSLLSMICAVSYSCIEDHFPDDLSNMKEEIFAMIRGSFTNYDSNKKVSS